MDWKHIPSLAALRAFEATARCGSYVGAARELNVTDAALRQHIRALEAHFDISLIERAGRGISVTQQGTELADGLSGGFSEIQRTVDRLRCGRRVRPVRVAITPGFAENWLIPRLPDFWADHPDIEVDLAPSIKPVDLTKRDHDLAIRYGWGTWPGCAATMIASAEYTVVASPKLAKSGSVAEMAELKDAVWLFESSRVEHQKWATEHGLQFESEKNRFFPNNSLVLSAVRAGHGYSVQSRALVETDLETGVLISVFRDTNPQLGYYLLHQKELRKSAKTFAKWLSSVAVLG